MFVDGAIPNNILQNTTTSDTDSVGAIAVFVGKVRDDKIDDRKVEKIEFTAQESIAESTFVEIIEDSKKRFGILDAEIFHSLGTVRTGEACFLVKVTGRHRKESFAAMPYIVDEVKNRCPIFGKEILTGGVHTWKENKK